MSRHHLITVLRRAQGGSSGLSKVTAADASNRRVSLEHALLGDTWSALAQNMKLQEMNERFTSVSVKSHSEMLKDLRGQKSRIESRYCAQRLWRSSHSPITTKPRRTLLYRLQVLEWRDE